MKELNISHFSVLDDAVLPVILIDRFKKIRMVNKSACKLFGYHKRELLNENVKILMPAQIADHHDKYVDKYIETHKKTIIGKGRVVTGLKKDRSELNLFLSVSEVQAHEPFFIGIIQDLTQQIRQNAKYKALDVIEYASWSFDVKKNMFYWDKNLFNYFAINESPDRSISLEKWLSLFQFEDRDKFRLKIQKCIKEKESIDIICKPYFSSNKIFRIFANYSLNYLGEVTYIDGVVIDVTDKIQYANLIINLDSLTRVYSRFFFEKTLKEAAKKFKETNILFAIIVIDIRKFKQINDYYGHDMGDKLLTKIATTLKESIRFRSQDILARIGGNEFAIFCNNISSKKEVELVVNRVSNIVNSRVKVGDLDIDVSSAIGVVFSDYDDNKIITYASYAIRAAKNKNLGICFFNEDIKKQYKEEAVLNHALKGLINKEHIKVVYQPIFEISTEKAIGVEALVRSSINEYKNVNIENLVRLIERNGLVDKLNKLIINVIFDELKTVNIPCDFRININISPFVTNFLQHLKDLVNLVLKKKKVFKNRCKVVFELTESALMDLTELELIEIQNVFKDAEILFAIDDFGTGYSTFERLIGGRFNLLKIDKSLLDKLADDVIGSNSTFKAIKEIATEMDMDIIVEGVETQESLDKLRNLGYKYVQGYLLSKPENLSNLVEQGIFTYK